MFTETGWGEGWGKLLSSRKEVVEELGACVESHHQFVEVTIKQISVKEENRME
jgi:hypothetical protein